MRYAPIALFTLALAAPALVQAGEPCQGRYIAGPVLNGTDGVVSALHTATTPQGTKLFIAGSFNVAGDKVSRRAAAWNGASWEAMNVYLEYEANVPYISQLLYFNNALYASGSFDAVNGNPAGGLMRWNGLAWLPWTAGASDDRVAGMLSHNGSLYVYGGFTSINGVDATGIARWNGVNFEPVGDFNTNVLSATVHNGQIHVSGYFSSIHGVQCRRMARFNGVSWVACDEGLQEPSYSIASHNGILYAAGAEDLDTPNQQSDGLNYWNGQFWSYLPGGDASCVRTINGTLYCGGYGGAFSDIVNIPGGVAAFNGTQWSGFGSGIGSWPGPGDDQSPWVSDLDLFGGNLHVGGTFSKAGSIGAQNIARWNGSAWTRLNTGAIVSDARRFTNIGRFNDGLVIAGYKKLHNNQTLNRVNLTTDLVNFQALPGEFTGSFSGFHQWGSDLYVFGYIQDVNGQPIEGIARWDGAQWQQLGGGLQVTNVGTYARVYDVAEYNGKLVCAGYFNQANGQPMNRISAWSGSGWTNLGAGTDGYISHLEVHNGQLYAAGSMTVAGGIPVQGSARWDGNAWHAVGFGPNPPGSEFHFMLEHDGELYAGVYHDLYRLVGNTWQHHSTIPDGDVHSPFAYDLTTYRGELCVIGDMGDLDGQNGGRQVKVYRNGQWLDIHPDRYIGSAYSGLEYRGELLTIGNFSAVGHVIAPNLARYRPDAPYIWDQPDEFTPTPCPGSTAHFEVQAVGGPILVYRWHRNNVPLVNGATGSGSVITGATLPHMQISNISSADDGIYTCVITSQCGDATSDAVRLIVHCCGPADIGSTGGVPGADGVLDNNDFVVFIDSFFNANPLADVGQQGGMPGPDGQFNNNDFVVYIDMFFAGCQ
ncbi:MAG TPA: immunoglobulin domain-containing protein [Phycisphaerales bacterium]|nr:immunoglobulin domain-containing protein [Phycisphaerales bacterium]